MNVRAMAIVVESLLERHAEGDEVLLSCADCGRSQLRAMEKRY